MKIPYSIIKSRNKLICTDGLALYSYILCSENRLGEIKVTTKMIKESGILKDNRRITKVLQELHYNNIIKINQDLLETDKIGDSTTINVSISPQTQFIKIPYKLYDLYINKVGSIGYLLLCILVMYHNSSYGSVINGSLGFSNPSYKHISEVTGLNKNTIIKYIKILESNKLIQVKSQPKIAKDDLTIKQESNHYIVKFITNEKDDNYCPK